ILHRDISVGNILIALDGKGGLLIDWELALNLNRKARTMRQWFTGTWQFMSVRLLQQISNRHDPNDDMESFLWVLVFVFLRYYPGSLSLDEAYESLNAIFNEQSNARGK
ncbi:hypothetical protein K488DRAFT_8131, partial [Vararia minispora EC-137]